MILRKNRTKTFYWRVDNNFKMSLVAGSNFSGLGVWFFYCVISQNRIFSLRNSLILFFILENKKSGPYRFGVVFLNKKLSERWETEKKNKINSYHGSTLSKYSLTAKVSDDNEVKCLTNISLLLSCYLQTIAPL